MSAVRIPPVLRAQVGNSKQVEAGGGTVGAESRDGLTRFWFSLPG
jgi:hypothetical protein